MRFFLNAHLGVLLICLFVAWRNITQLQAYLEANLKLKDGSSTTYNDGIPKSFLKILEATKNKFIYSQDLPVQEEKREVHVAKGEQSTHVSQCSSQQYACLHESLMLDPATTTGERAGKDFFAERSYWLGQQAKSLESQFQQGKYYEPFFAENKTTTVSLPVHFFTFATYSEGYNYTIARIIDEARKTHWFQTVTGYRTDHLPDAFVLQYEQILSLPRGGGYWLWKIVVLEMAMAAVPLGHFIVYLDAGCTLDKINTNEFRGALDTLSHASNLASNGSGNVRKEIFRYGLELTNPEHQWTTPRIFAAFNMTSPITENTNVTLVQQELKRWSNVTQTGQITGGVQFYRNGPHMRQTIALIYAALSKNPLIITDMYNEEAKKIHPEFMENRHDQSLLSVASKLLDNYILVPLGKTKYFHAARIRQKEDLSVEELIASIEQRANAADTEKLSLLRQFCPTCKYANGIGCRARLEYLKKKYKLDIYNAVEGLVSKGNCIVEDRS